MDLKKLSPSLLAVLGLACARTPATVGPCLSPPYDPSAGDVGPCLSPPVDPGDSGTTGEPTDPDPGDEPPIGPCLSPPAPGPVSDSPGLTSASAAEPAGSRLDALERVLARAALPPDVAERLRRHTGPNRGT